jgi:hypothetical protein
VTTFGIFGAHISTTLGPSMATHIHKQHRQYSPNFVINTLAPLICQVGDNTIINVRVHFWILSHNVQEAARLTTVAEVKSHQPEIYHELVDMVVGGDNEHINIIAIQKFSHVYEDVQDTCILCHLLLEFFERFQKNLCWNGVKKNSYSTCLLPHQS